MQGHPSEANPQFFFSPKRKKYYINTNIEDNIAYNSRLRNRQITFCKKHIFLLTVLVITIR